MHNYVIYRNDRDSHGGGVLLAIHENISSRIIAAPKGLECLIVDIFPNKSKFRLILAYIPNPKNYDYLSSIFTLIQTNATSIDSVCVFGDFNLPKINWKNNIFPNLKEYNYFKNFYYKLQPITQINTKCTRGDNILDLVFIRNTSILENLEILPPIDKSDHNILKIVFNLQSLNIKDNIQRKNFKTADYNKINIILQNELKEILTETSICNKWNLFNNTILNIIEKIVPIKKFYSIQTLKPWLNIHAINLYKIMQKKFKKYFKTNTAFNKKNYTVSKINYRKYCNYLKDRFEKSIKTHLNVCCFYKFFNRYLSSSHSIN